MMENLLERKKNEQVKGLISHMFFNTKYDLSVIPDVCTKLQRPRSNSFWEIFEEISICITLEWVIEKGKNK